MTPESRSHLTPPATSTLEGPPPRPRLFPLSEAVQTQSYSNGTGFIIKLTNDGTTVSLFDVLWRRARGKLCLRSRHRCERKSLRHRPHRRLRFSADIGAAYGFTDCGWGRVCRVEIPAAGGQDSLLRRDRANRKLVFRNPGAQHRGRSRRGSVSTIQQRQQQRIRRQDQRGRRGLRFRSDCLSGY